MIYLFIYEHIYCNREGKVKMKFAQMLFTAAIAFATAGGIGCAQQIPQEQPAAYVEPSQPSQTAEPTRSDVDMTGMKGDNTLAYSLNELMPTDKNYMFSPVSIKMALALAANGADGDTKAQILKAAGIDDLDEYNKYAENLISLYAPVEETEKIEKEEEEYIFDEKHEKTQLSIANSIWLNKDKAGSEISFVDTYLKEMQKFYFAGVSEVNNADAVEKINSWCSKQTKGKIPSVIDSPDFLAALVNAVYFKAEWVNQFEEYATHQDTFTDRNGKAQTVDFMEQTETFGYYGDDDIQMVRMRYSGGEAAMYVVLSGDKRVDITPYIDKMTGEEVHIKMPKFKIKYSETINSMLNKLGIEKAFVPGGADFSKMLQGGTDKFYISKVLHKTYIDVDENGTEAAAVTAMMMEMACIETEPPKIIDFIADKPFGYFIVDENTKEILFMGEYAFAN